MSEHTELPWAYKSNGHYFDIGIDNESNDLPIYPCAIIGVPHEQEANASLIVTAVNFHQRLREALELAVDFINKHPADPDITSEQVQAWQKLVSADPEALLAELDNLERKQ